MRARGSFVARPNPVAPDDVDFGGIASQGDGEPLKAFFAMFDDRPGPFLIWFWASVNGVAPTRVISDEIASGQAYPGAGVEFGGDVHTGNTYYGWCELRDLSGELLWQTPQDQRGPFIV